MENIQERFISILRMAISKNLSLAVEISSLLNLSLDSAYRRLRCETEFTLNETIALCNHFDIPIESLNAGRPHSVTFRFNQVLNDKTDFQLYLEAIYQDINMLTKAQDKMVRFAAEDIPVFYHFYQDELSAFKMFYWLKSLVGLEEYQKLKFNPEIIPMKMIETGKNIFEAYSKVPSLEIWTNETFLSTLKQIRFYWDAGFFENKEMGLKITSQLKSLLENLQKQANEGMKISSMGAITSNEYLLYVSDLMIGNNCVLVNAGSFKSAYISYNSFNSIKTTNSHFIEQSENWLTNLVNKSTMISKVGERQRNRFFNGMYEKIEGLISHINNTENQSLIM
jgi:hypothetical protein